MASGDALRSLRIKTAVVERTLKELLSYQKELEDNKREIDKVRASDDHSKLKQWENVLGETQGMIPDTSNRLSQATEDLKNFVDAADEADGLNGSSELQNAMSVLSKVTAALK